MGRAAQFCQCGRPGWARRSLRRDCSSLAPPVMQIMQAADKLVGLEERLVEEATQIKKHLAVSSQERGRRASFGAGRACQRMPWPGCTPGHACRARATPSRPVTPSRGEEHHPQTPEALRARSDKLARHAASLEMEAQRLEAQTFYLLREAEHLQSAHLLAGSRRGQRVRAGVLAGCWGSAPCPERSLQGRHRQARPVCRAALGGRRRDEAARLQRRAAEHQQEQDEAERRADEALAAAEKEFEVGGRETDRCCPGVGRGGCAAPSANGTGGPPKRRWPTQGAAS